MITFVEQKDLKAINDNITKLFKAIDELKVEQESKDAWINAEFTRVRSQIDQLSTRVR